MKILYFLDTANLYGSELHLLDLINYINKKNEVTLITFRNGELNKRLSKIGINYIQLNISWLGIFSNFFIILYLIKNFSPDIIHSHQPKALLFGGIFSKVLRIPHVITVHSKPLDHSLLHNAPMRWLVYFGHYLFNFISQLMAAKIIFVNNNMLNETFFKYKSSCIYNWLSPIHEKIKHPKILKKKINILSVGSISFKKGTDLLIDLYGLIMQDNRARDYTIALNVVGSGEISFFNSIINKSYQNSLHDINFLGYQSNTLPYYQEADIFILLSRTETFGLVYVEAMNYGLPIFALKIDVLEEIVPDWNFKSNNLNDLKDKFFELINSGNLYHEISKKNIEYSSDNFSYEKSMEETYKVYRELL